MSSDDQATALVEMEASLAEAPTASTRPAVEIKGRLYATGDVEVPELSGGIGQENKRETDEEEDDETVAVGPEQQIIEGAATILGLNGAGVDGGGGGAGKSKPSEGILANVIRSVIGAPFYPLKLVQVLIQLGHEPSPPERRYSFMFRQYLYYYPGLFGYARRIIEQDGWRALYRGVGGSMFAEVVHLSAVGVIRPTVNHVISKLPLQTVAPDSGGDVPDTEPESVETIRGVLIRALRTFLSNTITSVAVEMIVHPFHVISIRMIAQHVGKETIYTSVWRSTREIYHEEGLPGFYAGIVPALLAHLTRCVIYSSMWILFEVMAIHTPYNWAKMLIRVLIGMPLLNYLPRSYSYPFMLMSNVMAANDARLMIGRPPHTPIFDGWRDSYRYLKSIGASYRGSVVFFPRFVSRDPPSRIVMNPSY